MFPFHTQTAEPILLNISINTDVTTEKDKGYFLSRKWNIKGIN